MVRSVVQVRIVLLIFKNEIDMGYYYDDDDWYEDDWDDDFYDEDFYDDYYDDDWYGDDIYD